MMKNDRKRYFFCNQPLVEVKDEKIRNEVFSSIKTIGTYNMEEKYYQFLNFKNLSSLKSGEFVVSTSSYGKKYILYLKRIHDRNYCIFFNKKSKQMILGKFTFALPLFEGTLLDGELIKNSRNEWFFEISELIYYEGVNMITEKFEVRRAKIEHLLKNQFRHEPTNHCKLFMKKFIQPQYIDSFVKKYIPTLSYRCSGIVFKSCYNFSDNYTYIFPECRTDTQVLGTHAPVPAHARAIPTSTPTPTPALEPEAESSGSMDLFGVLCEVIDKDSTFLVPLIRPECERGTSPLGLEESVFRSEKEQRKSSEICCDMSRESPTHEKIELADDSVKNMSINPETYCKFMVKDTGAPDVYELYCKSASGNIEKYGYAAIPSMSASKMMCALFTEQKEMIMRCKYHKHFKKWYPTEKHHKQNHEVVDLLYHINKVKIIIDNMEDEEI